MLDALKRIAIAFAITVAVVLALGLLAYLFGGPTGPSKEDRAAYEALVAEGSVEPVEDHFVVPIPGCNCHSDNAVLVVRHAERRLRDCGSCH